MPPIGLATAALPMFMTGKVEAPIAAPAFGSFRPLAGLAALFALDSLGGGFVANAVIAYCCTFALVRRLVARPRVRSGGRPSGVSYEASGRLSSRFGLVNTMVFTHLPSNVLLLLVPFSPSLSWAIGLLLARFALSQMDVSRPPGVRRLDCPSRPSAQGPWR